MDKAHPLSSPMIIHSLNVKNDPFHHCENGEELLGLEVPYLSVVAQILLVCQFISQV